MMIFEEGGKQHVCDSGRDMLKAMGITTGRPTFMFDESGELVAAGTGVENLNKSMPLIKAMKESQPLHKPRTAKPAAMTKSFGLDKVFNDLQAMSKARGLI